MNAGAAVRRPALALLLAWAGQGFAQTFPVDDSASQVLSAGIVPMRWDAPVPGPGRGNGITGEVVVRVVLDVAPWRGRRARIWQTLAPNPAGRVTATWTADGPLSAGVLHDGGRALVYAGPIDADRLTDTFRITLQADGDRVVRPQSLEFAFEIEPEPVP